MPEPLTTTVALTASLAGVAKLATETTNYLQQATADHLQLKKADKIIRSVTDRIIEIRKVKTILDLEHEVEIGDFYTPQHVRLADKRILISTIDALPYDGNTVFTGIAGQGKSVFFRYLAGRVPEDGRTLPLFIELRRLAHQPSLEALLVKELDVLGFSAQELVLEKLAESGRIVLFLDAFDEIPVEAQSRFIADIEDFCRKYPHLKILITSRPNNAIESSAQFRVVALDAIRGNEYQQIVRKIGGNEQAVCSIIAGVENDNCQIKNLLTTPLMVTLLVLRFKLDASIPDNEEAFYGDLFDLLARRHDKTKPGFERNRRTDVTETKLERLFGGVCFFSRIEENVEISRSDLARYAEKSATVQSLVLDAENAIHDVVEITCLLLEESGIFQFPHRTIQEFFAARFLKQQPDEITKQFYRKLIENWEPWDQVLRFLEMLDQYQFLRHFLLPNARQWLCGNRESDPMKLTPSKMEKAKERIFAKGLVIAVHSVRKGEELGTTATFPALVVLNESFYLLQKTDVSERVASYLGEVFDKGVTIEELKPLSINPGDTAPAKVLHLPVKAACENPKFPELARILQEAVEETVSLYGAYQAQLGRVDSLADLNGTGVSSEHYRQWPILFAIPAYGASSRRMQLVCQL